FFGIHPMHVESVAWVSERKDLMYSFFFLAGLITYLRYNETKKNSWYAFTFLLFILSCLSKVMAIVFPFILLLLDYFFALVSILYFPFLLVAIVALIYFFLRKEKTIIFGSLFYFITVVMVLQFITGGPVIIADRYSYISYIGLLFLVAWYINRSWQEKNNFLA